MTTTKNAVIYARVSSKEQETGGYSIPAQLDFLKNYAKQNSLNVVQIFTESVSAKDKNCRIEYDNMIKFAKKQKGGCHILVEKTDRLLRNEFNSAEIIDLARNTDITIHLVKENLTLEKNSPPTTFFIFTMFTANSSLYPRNLSNEVKKGMNKKAELGFFPDKAPVGYKNLRENKKHSVVVVDNEKAQFIKKAFELYATGNYSYSQIAKILTNDGFIMRTRPPHKNNIEHILKNPFYYGDFIYNNQYYIGNHQPIITKELFLNVQKIINREHHPQATKYNFLFSNMIECAKCGQLLTADIKKGKYIYYRCFGKKKNNFKCQTKLLSETKIEKSVIESLEKIKVTKETKKDIIQKIKVCVNSETDYSNQQIDNNNKNIKLLTSRLNKLYLDKLDGIISEDFFTEKYQSWSLELEQLKKQNENLLKDFDDVIQKCELILELLEKAPSLYLRLNRENKRLLLQTLFSNFLWNGETLVIKVKSVFDTMLKHDFSQMVGGIGLEPTTPTMSM